MSPAKKSEPRRQRSHADARHGTTRSDPSTIPPAAPQLTADLRARMAAPARKPRRSHVTERHDATRTDPDVRPRRDAREQAIRALIGHLTTQDPRVANAVHTILEIVVDIDGGRASRLIEA